MALKRITASTVSCVSLDEIKSFLRLSTSTTEDTLLTAFIKAAESYAENYMKRSINKQQWELRLNSFSEPPENCNHSDNFLWQRGDIELPRPPLTSSSSEVEITYVDDATAGTTTSVESSAVTIDYFSEPGKVYPSYDNEWPEAAEVRDAVRIIYYSGYATSNLVPEPIKQWVKLRVGAMYENRESLMVGSGNFISELPHSYVDGLLDEFTVPSV